MDDFARGLVAMLAAAIVLRREGPRGLVALWDDAYVYACMTRQS